MRTFIGAALTTVIASVAGSTTPSAMSGYLWQSRPVLVFAPSETDASLAEQRRVFAASQGGLIDRDVVVVWVVGDVVRTDFGPVPGMSAAQLRARFGAPRAAFRVVLVGKDGGSKLSQSSPIATETLYGTIDAMPMRRDEMRHPR